MSDLVVVSDTAEIGLARQASDALARLSEATTDEAKVIRDDADALFDVLRRRGWALEAINPLAEVKVAAERKIGSARASIPRDPSHRSGPTFDWSKAKFLLDAGFSKKETARIVKVAPQSLRYAERSGFKRKDTTPTNELREFDENLGLGNLGGVWQRLAAIPEDLFNQYLREITEDGQEITTARILYRHGINTNGGRGERVESGIFVIPDGRYVIRYRYRGRSQQETLKTKNIEVARRTLLKRRGLIKEAAKSKITGLDRGYSELRSCLNHLDKSTPKLNPDARRHTLAAIALLHKAEDELTRAINVEN